MPEKAGVIEIIKIYIIKLNFYLTFKALNFSRMMNIYLSCGIKSEFEDLAGSDDCLVLWVLRSRWVLCSHRYETTAECDNK